MVILIFIITGVGVILRGVFLGGYVNRSLLENQTVEVIWTLTPAVILLFIAFPSLKLLYLLDEVGEPALTVKIIGHQWYWRYEYSDFSDVRFDSYIIPERDLRRGGFRALEVDTRIVVPFKTPVRVLVTAADVIHSWTLPRLGVKTDAIPGRLNQLRFTRLRPGVIYGQCSEICGANHRFIPIVLESVNISRFFLWLTKLR